MLYKSLRTILVLFATLLFLPAATTHAVTLNILEWEGYISPFAEDFKKYAKQNGMDVNLNIIEPFITDPDYIFRELRAGRADVVTPTHNYFKMSEGKLFNVLRPLDFAKMKNYSKVLSSLRSAKYDQFQGGKYSVPLLGGSYGLAYNASKMSAPASWNIFWDPKYKGKYAVTSDQFEANVYIAMLALGYPPQTLYDVNDKNFKQSEVQKKLNELVANAGSFWGGLADAEQMKSLDLVTTYWFGVAEANKQGQNWKLASPSEGQTVWLDTMSVGAHVKDDKLKASYLLLDFMLTEEVQKKILEMYGSIIVNGETAKLLDAETAKKGRVGDETFFDERYFWRPLSARTRNIYKSMWQKAQSNAKAN